MKSTHATLAELDQALATINADRYAGNVEMYEVRQGPGTAIRFRLRVHDFDRPGYRRRTPHLWDKPDRDPARMRFACWHVHGDFFDALLEINPRARIESGPTVITAAGGNWQDRNIGSLVLPVYHSEACDCRRYDH